MVNDNFDRITVGLSQKIVIDRSMTILSRPYQIVIDWSMTTLIVLQLGNHRKLSMTIWKPPLGRIRNRLSQKIVIDQSMTILK